MDLKTLNAIIDLLGPEDFEEFKNEIRRSILTETGTDLEAARKEIKAYRTSLVNFARHALQVLLHYNIPLEKLEEKIESLTSAPAPVPEPISEPASEPEPASAPAPIEIPPEIKEVIRPSSTTLKKRPGQAKPVLSSAQDRAMLQKGVITCLRSTGKSTMGVLFEDILVYLEKVIHFPVNSAYWQHRGNDNRSRFEAAVRFQLNKLRMAGKIRQENRFWYLS